MAAISDPIADMLTRIRNAILARHQQVTIPSSKIKVRIAEILQEEGYIEDFSVEAQQPQDVLTVQLRYKRRNEAAIQGIRRISRPGRRVYSDARTLPRVRNGLGIAILSTSSGLMSDKKARESNDGKGIGGEVLCYVW